jgi:hypothetical protein
MPEAGDFTELLLLYYNYRYTPAILVDFVSACQSATKAINLVVIYHMRMP